METLQELREKYNKLDRERDIIYNKILELEDKEMLRKFTMGECFLDTWNDNFNKIIAIDGKEFYCMNVNKDAIRREFTTLESVKGWKKITSEQFDSMLSAVLKDLQDPDLEDKKESNWSIVYNSYDIRSRYIGYQLVLYSLMFNAFWHKLIDYGFKLYYSYYYCGDCLYRHCR